MQLGLGPNEAKQVKVGYDRARTRMAVYNVEL